MKSREITILAIALGVWVAWRLVGSSLLPVGSQEIGIAIIVLFKPWLDFRGWMSLLTINAMSYVHAWYWAYVTVSNLINERYGQAMIELGLAKTELLESVDWRLGLSLSLILNFLYFYYVWPYIWERAYLKAGIWGKLKWEK